MKVVSSFSLSFSRGIYIILSLIILLEENWKYNYAEIGNIDSLKFICERKVSVTHALIENRQQQEKSISVRFHNYDFDMNGRNFDGGNENCL